LFIADQKESANLLVDGFLFSIMFFLRFPNKIERNIIKWFSEAWFLYFFFGGLKFIY